VEGRYNIFVVASVGGPARQLTTNGGANPRWSGNGQWVYFHSSRSGRSEIWKIPAEGGEAIQVTTSGGSTVAESYDGKHLYYRKDDALWKRSIEDGDEILLLDNLRGCSWCLGERGVYVLNRKAKPLPCIQLFDDQSLELAIVAVLSEDAADTYGAGQQISVSPGDEWLVYQVSSHEADIMLVESFQ
jgi:hypothetical protein